jgi:uncharacterized protein with HEPN domain
MRSDRLLMQDILDAAAVIEQYLPADQATFDADPPLQSHILRHLQILGEAAWRLSKPLKDAHPEVPWKLIAGMRHILVHDYFRVDWRVVFNTARDHAPTLASQIAKILAELLPDAR